MATLLKPTFDVDAAAMANQLANELGLPNGNLWEPATARLIAAELQANTFQATYEGWRARMGLKPLYSKDRKLQLCTKCQKYCSRSKNICPHCDK